MFPSHNIRRFHKNESSVFSVPEEVAPPQRDMATYARCFGSTVPDQNAPADALGPQTSRNWHAVTIDQVQGKGRAPEFVKTTSSQENPLVASAGNAAENTPPARPVSMRTAVSKGNILVEGLQEAKNTDNIVIRDDENNAPMPVTANRGKNNLQPKDMFEAFGSPKPLENGKQEIYSKKRMMQPPGGKTSITLI